MKNLIFDTGPIISLTLNYLAWIFKPLKNNFKGEFLITEGIREELVDKPLRTKKFEFEALHAAMHIREGVFKIYKDKKIDSLVQQLLELANHCFSAKGYPMKILHKAEVEGMAAAILLNADGFVVDERSARLLIEDPDALEVILSRKLHTKIKKNEKNIRKFKEMTKGIRIIRSVELVVIAYELGLLDKYLPDLPHARKILLDSVLWGVKTDGCSVSGKEINQIQRLEFVSKG